MKAILVSIQPKWVEKIISGEKTIEVRKTAPKEVPFKVYMYETKNGGGKGKVIGEFVCNKVDRYAYDIDCYDKNKKMYYIRAGEADKACLSYDEILTYGKEKTLYGLHISDLKVYDKPKDISEFFIKGACQLDRCVPGCLFLREYYFEWVTEYDCVAKGRKPMTRPPQSWCYIEEV